MSDHDSSWRERLPRLSRGFLRDFEILRPLSSGGQFLGTHLPTREPVVLRFLEDLRPGELARFDRATPTLRTLDHPRLLRIVDAGLDGPVAYLATQVARSRSLAQRSQRRACSLREALDIGARVADVLAHLHERGVVHGELRLSSLFVTEEYGDVSVGDAGLTGVLGGGANPNARRALHPSTVATLSPEQALGQEPGPASDQYALGVILYQLISRTLPFEGRDAGEIAQARILGDPAPLRRTCPALPLSAEEPVMRAMSRDPRARFHDAADMAHALQRTARELGPKGAQVFAVRSGWADAAGSSPQELDGLGSQARPARLSSATTGVIDLFAERNSSGQEPIDVLLANEQDHAAPPRPRARASFAGRLVFALAGMGLVVWSSAQRPRAPVAALKPAVASPSFAPPVAASPLAGIVRSMFPAHRRLVVHLADAVPANATLEAAETGVDHPAITVATLDASRRIATFDDLRPERTLEIAVVQAPSRRVAGRVKTPALVVLHDVQIAPADTAVLVDYEATTPVELTVEIGRDGDDAPTERRVQPMSAAGFHAVFGDLEPDTRYWVRVRSGLGWGGLARCGFTTLPATHGTRVDEWSRNVLVDGADLTDGFSLAYREPDTRLVAPAMALCVRRPALARNGFDGFAALAGAVRAPELVEALRPLATTPETRTTLARAARSARSPLALELAREVLAQATDPQLIARVAPALASSGAAGCELLAAAKERVPSVPAREVAANMHRADAARAREHFLRWLDTAGPDSELVPCAILGLELGGQDADVERLGRLLSRAERSGVRSMAAAALASMPGARAREVLRQAFEWDPERLELLWANARTYRTSPAGAPEAARDATLATLERLARDAQDPALRRDAALGLGYIGASGDLLVHLLESSSGDAADGAAWALARMHDTRAVPALIKRVSAEDPAGISAFALGRLSATDGADALIESLAERPIRITENDAIPVPLTPGAEAAMQLRIWALGTVRARSATEPLAELAADQTVTPHTRALAQEAAALCSSPPSYPSSSTALSLAVLALAPFDRTGIDLVPGDVVDLTVTGAWTRPTGGPAIAAYDRFATEDGTSRGLVAQIGSQVVALDSSAPRRIVVERSGELIVSPYGVLEGVMSKEGQVVPRSRLLGLAVVRIERAR